MRSEILSRCFHARDIFMADQPQHAEIAEQLKQLEYAFQIQERLGMYVPRPSDYYCVIGFFMGLDVGACGKLFSGFQEFLVSKYGEPRNLMHYALITLLCFGEDAHLKMQQAENHLTAIEYFFASLKEFQQGLQETEYLLRSPANAKRILTALERAKSENLRPTTIDSLNAEIQ